MRACLSLICLAALLFTTVSSNVASDADFSEFDDIEAEPGADKEGDDAFVENDEDDDSRISDLDFDHFQDSEEFEGHDTNQFGSSSESKSTTKKKNKDKPDLKIKNIPLRPVLSWRNYYLEIASTAILVIYFLNYIIGRYKNSCIAGAWLDANKLILDANFALVGDDGVSQEQTDDYVMVKEAEHVYTMWCSGRQYVDGLLIELRLIRRQCLLGRIIQLFKPCCDQVIFQVQLEVMEPMVWCISLKKPSVQKYLKDCLDIITYCADRKPVSDKYAKDLGDNFVVYAENNELTQTFLQDTRIVTLLGKYRDVIELIHISDQYSPERPTSEELKIRRPPVQKALVIQANVPGRGRNSETEFEEMTDLLKLCLYVTDKAARMKLSKETKSKAEKSRQRVEEVFLKFSHSQRQELAQQRREERIRMERERILAEDDPEKQRRLEAKEQKRLAKKNTPKLKQMKVRAM